MRVQMVLLKYLLLGKWLLLMLLLDHCWIATSSLTYLLLLLLLVYRCRILSHSWRLTWVDLIVVPIYVNILTLIDRDIWVILWGHTEVINNALVSSWVRHNHLMKHCLVNICINHKLNSWHLFALIVITRVLRINIISLALIFILLSLGIKDKLGTWCINQVLLRLLLRIMSLIK